ncbi:MAG: hypothetical protein A2031_07390 [Deltaproteobacteria bacterium RBG_19FT_COMBO_43_11]|nr:MAG: hypothetical protein A2031_07390 [Deltaproteobacteria bacterium RBG_19FT_COMBO_43_11]
MPYIKAQCIIVVDNNISGDVFSETVMRMAVPSEIELIISSVDDFAQNYIFAHDGKKKAIVLFSNINDVCKAFNSGFHFDKLNIGNIHNEEFKICCSPSVSLCDKEIQDIIRLLENAGVVIELKRVPRERAVNIKEALKDYCKSRYKEVGF